MDLTLVASLTLPVESIALLKRSAPIALLTLFWLWESGWPYFGQREGRWRHGGRNLTIALANTAVLGLLFGSVTVAVATWTEQRSVGLLNLVGLTGPVHFVLAILLLDGWMYAWHRANHAIPLLWRFHRMHHSDPHMDVTTATRFHLGEHIGASTLRLALIPLFGVGIWEVVIYDTLVIAVTQFHHADISIGRFDRLLRWFVVTPYMHKVHHSDWQPETDSNYSTVFSFWDRLGSSFKMRSDPKTLVFGLVEFHDPAWQSWSGMWKTPFVNAPTQNPNSLSSAQQTSSPAPSNHLRAG